MFMLTGVTGANGFIGSHLIEQLEKSGHKYRSFHGDLLDMGTLETFMQGCSQVIHLAGVFSNDFDQLMNVNVKGTRNVVEACKKHGVKRVIFSSTGAVYGEPLKEGISHEEDSLLPNTLYGLSKAYAEEYIRFSSLPFVILRFPNVYGPNNQKGVIYHFIDSIKKQKKVTIFGTGEQRRNFLFVEDAVTAILKALELSKNNEIFNIADKDAYSLNNLVLVLKETLSLKFEVDFRPADKSNQLQVLSESIEKARALLEWRPMVSISEGISKVIKSYEI